MGTPIVQRLLRNHWNQQHRGTPPYQIKD